eukprot:maker-scaffold_19-snap-gene-1.4-mRNA-1 protein AED:0.04 eAED:0.04 QI:129/1/1/1/0.66/0.5/4/342/525
MFRTKNLSRSLHISRRNFGALTSKPYAFTARPWELRNTETVDNMNSLGSNISVQTRGVDLLRVLPRVNDSINEEWIDDKTRFSYDGLKLQRLIKPMFLKNPSPNPNWREMFTRLSEVIGSMPNKKVRGITNASSDLQSILAFSDFLNLVNKEYDAGEEMFLKVSGSGNGKAFGYDLPENYRFNSELVGLDESDLVLTIGTNLNTELPQLISRMRKGFLRDRAQFAHIGYYNEFAFPVEQLGLSPLVLKELVEGTHFFCAELAEAENPVLVVDSSIFEREDADAIVSGLEELVASSQYPNIKKENISFLHCRANDVGVAELGRSKALTDENLSEKTDILYLMQVGVEDLPNGEADIQKLRDSCDLLIFQGSHGDALASVADVVLPSAAFTERPGSYGNVEGRFQTSLVALPAPGLAKHDWEIFRALSEVLGKKLPYDSFTDLTKRLASLVPSIESEGHIESWDGESEIKDVLKVAKDTTGVEGITDEPFRPVRTDFYLQGHAVVRASPTMAKCSREFTARETNFAN